MPVDDNDDDNDDIQSFQFKCILLGINSLYIFII